MMIRGGTRAFTVDVLLLGFNPLFAAGGQFGLAASFAIRAAPLL